MHLDRRRADLHVDDLRAIIDSSISIGAMIRLAVDEPPCCPLTPETLESVYPESEHDFVRDFVLMKTGELIEMFGDPCPPDVRKLLHGCMESAWICGARKAAMLPIRVDSSKVGGDSTNHRRTWQETWRDLLVSELTDHLRGLGWLLSGDTGAPRGASDPDPAILRSRSPSGAPALLTTWISDRYLTGAYRWWATSEDGRVQVMWQRRGDYQGRPHVDPHDARALVEMMLWLENLELLSLDSQPRALELDK